MKIRLKSYPVTDYFELELPFGATFAHAANTSDGPRVHFRFDESRALQIRAFKVIKRGQAVKAEAHTQLVYLGSWVGPEGVFRLFEEKKLT